MRARDIIRVAGPIIGAVGAVFASHRIGGAWGLVVGFVIFFLTSWIADCVWRRGASVEEIRKDLEARARDTSMP
jgi:hypothetical protein